MRASSTALAYPEDTTHAVPVPSSGATARGGDTAQHYFAFQDVVEGERGVEQALRAVSRTIGWGALVVGYAMISWLFIA